MGRPKNDVDFRKTLPGSNREPLGQLVLSCIPTLPVSSCVPPTELLSVPQCPHLEVTTEVCPVLHELMSEFTVVLVMSVTGVDGPGFCCWPQVALCLMPSSAQ